MKLARFKRYFLSVFVSVVQLSKIDTKYLKLIPIDCHDTIILITNYVNVVVVN